MHRLVRDIVVAAAVLAALTFASGAWSLPPECEFSCTCNSRCSQVCAIGNWVTTCAFDQICQDFCFAATPTELELEAASPVLCEAEQTEQDGLRSNAPGNADSAVLAQSVRP